MDAVSAATFDGEADHLLDALVPLVIVEGDDAAVAVDPEGELSEIVRADREAVEQLREPIDQDDVVRDLAHRIDLEPVLAALEAELRHAAEDLLRLLRPGARRGA